MCTIVESPTEFFSVKIKKNDQQETIVQELLANHKGREYFKKFNEIQEKSTSGGRKYYRQMQERKKRW